MRFPPHLLDEIRNRLSISSVVGRSVTWDRRKTNSSKGDYWACCPFHSEKSPSFHVEDRKGRYHCFGCKASGDIFTFLVEKEGATFPEAVERLAEQAGVALPKPSAEDHRREQVRATLHDVMQRAFEFFQQQLSASAARGARDYLAKRKIPGDVIQDFGIGYAPADRHALRNHLAGLEITVEQMVEAGLLVSTEGAAGAYDRFRDRVMFPIRDPRGRVIAFGGRALAADAMAKYLNSPETPIFSKGAGLFNYDRARPAAYKASALYVVEGYFGVVAAVRAGVPQTVATLGTALTTEQLSLLWRTAPEPVMCFDGDAAGLKAAYRALDLALPMLPPGRSLRFCTLPSGMDPDDIYREQGAQALRDALSQTAPMIDVLWDRAMAANDRSTPERSAQFERDLMAQVEQISDETVRSHYRTAVRSRIAEQFNPRRAAHAKSQTRGNQSWRVGQPGKALLGSLAALEKSASSRNQLRDEGCFDEE
jgi:DNA primase